LMFRVAIDTDIELLRRLFKKIGEDMVADPELAPDIIEAFKSKGISEIEDGTLVVHGAFKTKAGQQSLVRRKVLAAVHRAFAENGIRTVPRLFDATKPAA
jgi:moderate conductance mechanosensitive channel